MNIITRGLGQLTKLLTRGYGKDFDVAGVNRPPRIGRTKKEYSIEFYVPVQKYVDYEFGVYIPIKKSINNTIKIYSSVLKSISNQIGIYTNINHKKLFNMIDAI